MKIESFRVEIALQRNSYPNLSAVSLNPYDYADILKQAQSVESRTKPGVLLVDGIELYPDPSLAKGSVREKDLT